MRKGWDVTIHVHFVRGKMISQREDARSRPARFNFTFCGCAERLLGKDLDRNANTRWSKEERELR